MPDAVYKIKFTMSDGSVKEVQFTAPQGPEGPAGTTNPVYSRSFFGTFVTFNAYLNNLYKANFNKKIKITYSNIEGAAMTISGSSSGSVSINPGNEVYVVFNYTSKNVTVFLISNGVVNPTPTTLNGDTISVRFGNIINSYVTINSAYDLSSFG